MRVQLGWMVAVLATLLTMGTARVGSEPGAWAQSKPPSPLLKEGETAPDFTLKTPQGKPLTLSVFARNRVVLLDFFFISSDFCRMQLPHLQKAYEQFQAQGLTVLCVDIGRTDSPSDIQRYWEANKLTLPVVKNEAGSNDASKAYRIVNCPTSYLVGKDRKVLARWVGFLAANGPQRLKEQLAKAGFKQP